ncbi:MAG: YegP family protein [Ectothiorhodospira sp.]
MAGWYELGRGSNGQYRFTLKGEDRKTLLTSETYKEKGSAENGIESVRKNCGHEERYERKTASNGRFFFNLKAGNHQIIGTSPMHATEADREAAIAATRTAGASAQVRGQD